MKKNYLKVTSILLCAALITAGGGTAIHAVHAEKEEKTKKVQKVKTEKELMKHLKVEILTTYSLMHQEKQKKL